MMLIDTNILLRLCQPDHPHHTAAKLAVARLIKQETSCVITPQIAAEFWSVCTRPAAVNGFGLTPVEAAEKLANFEALFPIHAGKPEAEYTVWKQLLTALEIKGVQAHDARLAAFMIVSDIPSILTFNGADFQRFTGITVHHPDTV
ncbi:MAG: type II toxin-antitoxin system VapC family toxin [Holosporales bacterium]|jgi:predicted nucleic acid-binding protein